MEKQKSTRETITTHHPALHSPPTKEKPKLVLSHLGFPPRNIHLQPLSFQREKDKSVEELNRSNNKNNLLKYYYPFKASNGRYRNPALTVHQGNQVVITMKILVTAKVVKFSA